MRVLSRALLWCLPLAANMCGQSLPVRLVLTKQFCATSKRLSIAVFDVVKVGPPTCQRLPAALAPVFAELERVDQIPPHATGPQQNGLVLVPKFGAVSSTSAYLPGGRQQLTVPIEWTVYDSAGNMVWVQSVRGVASSAMPMPGKPRTKWIQTAIEDLLRASVAAMSAAPELKQARK